MLWTVVLEKTLESPLDFKKIQPVNPKGNQSWVFIGRTNVEAESPIRWPPDAKSWLIWKDPDSGKDGGQEEKGTTEDEMVVWHHRLNETWVWVNSEWDTTEQLNWTEQLTLSTLWGFSFCKTACNTWLRILSIAFEEKLNVLDFV